MPLFLGVATGSLGAFFPRFSPFIFAGGAVVNVFFNQLYNATIPDDFWQGAFSTSKNDVEYKLLQAFDSVYQNLIDEMPQLLSTFSPDDPLNSFEPGFTFTTEKDSGVNISS